MPTLRIVSTLLLLTLFCGCATHPSVPREERSPADPWEPLNRQIHGFNTGLDKVTLKPVAKGYRAIIPRSWRTGVTNFSRNLRGPLNIVNNLLQGSPRESLTETWRFLANSTFGILGLVDVATDMGLERYPEDFGQTFGKWGIPDGPFVIVPILGPYSLRHAISIPFNLFLDPLWHLDNAPVRDRLYVLRLIDIRYRLFSIESLLDNSADPYITTRESYLQNRRYLVFDGEPPEDDEFYDDFEDFDEEE
jgi:phospholipid-binding lipoprotein MlaA